MSQKVEAMNSLWMRNDALFLKENNRLRGCLTLLLCLVDAQAAQQANGKKGNRDRYCEYLKQKLTEFGIDSGFRIEEKNQVVHLSEIIYKYFRCSLVHEGDSRDNFEYEVQLKYEKNPKSVFGAGILIDRPNNQFVVQADWLIDLLINVTAENEL